MSFELSVTIRVPSTNNADVLRKLTDLAAAIGGIGGELVNANAYSLGLDNRSALGAAAPAPVAETPAPAPVAETPAPAPVAETPAPVAETPAPVAETKARRTRKAQVDAPAPVAETPAPVAETLAPVAETPATLDDVKAVTTRVAANLGRDAAVGLLSRFGATKATLVEPAKFGAFIAAANALLEG